LKRLAERRLGWSAVIAHAQVESPVFDLQEQSMAAFLDVNAA
jgi:hypothetical protein